MVEATNQEMPEIFKVLREFKPLGLPVWINREALDVLAEQIGSAVIRDTRDPGGLKILAPIDVASLPDIAREAVRRGCGATTVNIIGEPDQEDESTRVIRGFGGQ